MNLLINSGLGAELNIFFQIIVMILNIESYIYTTHLMTHAGFC